MYKILLVDDESQVRKGLKAKIGWEEHGFEICGEAANGIEALESIALLKPDVVITDVRMPMMDGIELLRKCGEMNSSVRFIVLSGYEEFNYVKAAMKYGAIDYLLKPVIRKELLEQLNQIKQELDEEKRMLAHKNDLKRQLNRSIHFRKEQFWLQAVRGATRENINEWLEEANLLGITNVLQEDAHIRFVTVQIRDIRESMAGTSPDNLLLLAAYFMTSELLHLWGEEAYVFRDPAALELLQLVFHCKWADDDSLEQWLTTEYQLQLEKMLRIRVQLGIGILVCGPGEWRKGYLSSRVNWMQQAPPDLYSTVHNNRKNQSMEWFDLLPITEKQLTAAIMEGDIESFQRALRPIFEADVPMSLQDLSMRMLRLLLYIDTMAMKSGCQLEEVQQVLSGLPESIWEYQSPDKAEQFFVSLARRLIQHIQQEPQTSGYEVVMQVVAYLENYYFEEDLTLTSMAQRFHLHLTYLSELFKKITGENYSDYLTDLRISKAKELLNDPLLKISDIAELVGFSNSNYFSQVFRKATGISPVEFRRQKTL